MKEIFKTVPENEKGALGPIDNINRFTYKWSKRIALGSGAVGIVAPLVFPVAFPVAIAASAWAVGDKLQIEGSKWVRRKIKGDMKQGQEIVLPQAA